MSEEKTKFCHACGVMIPYNDTHCPSCGEPQQVKEQIHRPPPRKKVWLAVVLSFFITGLGQLYLGRWTRGLSLFLGTLIVAGILSSYLSYDQTMVFGVFMAIVSAIDAYNLAKISD